MTYIYIASPYSHPDPAVMHDRYLTVTKCTVNLFNKGLNVYSPIMSWHNAARMHNLPTEYAAWQKHARRMIAGGIGLFVCTMPGWRESRGVHDEIAIAMEFDYPVTWISPEGDWHDGVQFFTPNEGGDDAGLEFFEVE